MEVGVIHSSYRWIYRGSWAREVAEADPLPVLAPHTPPHPHLLVASGFEHNVFDGVAMATEDGASCRGARMCVFRAKGHTVAVMDFKH